MLGRLILLFIIVPLTDLVLLLVLTQYTDWRVTVGTVIVSGVIGAFLARRSSQAVTSKIRERLSQGQMSPDLLSDGALIFFAAGLLLTPGFITDFVGFTLLIPFCRKWYKARITSWFMKNFKFQVVQGGSAATPSDPNTVDGAVVNRPDDQEDDPNVLPRLPVQEDDEN